MRVVFAGGGTGGHINPAISIANYAKSQERDFDALFIGTRKGLETRLVPGAGYDIKYVDVQGFDRKHLMKNVEAVRKLLKSRRDCKKILSEFRPDCVVCTGGYVSGPVVMAASKLGIPSLIHEQNVYPGLTVRGSEKYVRYLALSFDETVNEMKEKSKCRVTGNPIREEILNAEYAKSRKRLKIERPFVLIFGGSLGSDKINDTVVNILERIIADDRISLLFGTGDRNYEKVIRGIKSKEIGLNENVRVVPYIDNMAEAMAAADLVVSRSGAITVSEIAALGRPSILIPSPNVVRNHQEQNAREFEKNDAAAVISESELSPEILYKKITSLVSDRGELERMSKNLKKLAKTDALEKIYGLMLEMCRS